MKGETFQFSKCCPDAALVICVFSLTGCKNPVTASLKLILAGYIETNPGPDIAPSPMNASQLLVPRVDQSAADGSTYSYSLHSEH